jgi:RNA polymerase sigma-70 factor (ECF subfamily)
MSDHDATFLQHCLDRLREGDRAAGRELVEHTWQRLERLARLMLKGYPRLQRWEETGDVLQNALLRLCRALEAVAPPSLRDYYRLATVQIRRELLDLVRHHFGPHGDAGKHQTEDGRELSTDGRRPAYEQSDVTHEPGGLAAWGEFHRQVGALPEEEQEVFDLVWYQQLTHAEAAELLGVSTKTVQRRWQAACLKLHDALGGKLPG